MFTQPLEMRESKWVSGVPALQDWGEFERFEVAQTRLFVMKQTQLSDETYIGEAKVGAGNEYAVRTQGLVDTSRVNCERVARPRVNCGSRSAADQGKKINL